MRFRCVGLLNAVDGVSVHLCKYLRVGLTTSDARAGDEMGLVGEVLRGENLVSRFYYSRVIQINLIHEKPRANAVVGERNALVFKVLDIVFKQNSGLRLRIFRRVTGIGQPQMAIGSVTRLEKAIFKPFPLHVRRQIHPKGQLRAVEWRLLNDAHGAVGRFRFASRQQFDLVACIAQEIALKHRLGTTCQAVFRLVVCRENRLQLLAIRQHRIRDAQHEMEFLDLRAAVETENPCFGVVKSQNFVHKNLILPAKIHIFYGESR